MGNTTSTPEGGNTQQGRYLLAEFGNGCRTDAQSERLRVQG